MPIDKSKYPANWKQIALAVKETAGWACQQCGRPCRKPGVIWGDFCNYLLEADHGALSHWYLETYDEVVYEESGEHTHIEKPQRFTLTVAHLNHNESDCSPDNLKALCSGCHLRYDAGHHAKNAAATRKRKQAQQSGQLELLC